MINARSTSRLGIQAFDRAFDCHFHICSAMIDDALQNGTSSDPSTTLQCAPLPGLKSNPGGWGIKVSFVFQFWKYVAGDLNEYAAAHDLDENLRHVCLVPLCRWCHEGAEPLSRHQATSKLTRMRTNMHLVCSRYIKPWTEARGAGLALVLNAGRIAGRLNTTANEHCLADVFISHSWNEVFEDFLTTLRHALDPDTVVWVCSFAIWQHGDINNDLRPLERCPFALAMCATHRVLAVTDRTAEAFERCWVDLEAELAMKWSKPYDISLPDDGDADLWRIVGKRLDNLNIEDCKATCEEDRMAILEYAREGPGGIAGLNDKVRSIARQAMGRAELMAAISSGDVDRVLKYAAELENWRSIRGRSAAHVLAAQSHVAALLQVLEQTRMTLLNIGDDDGRTPLSVAVEGGSVSAVAALIGLHAELEIPSHAGLTPLHYGSAGGQSTIVAELLDAMAHVEAQGTYKGRSGMRPCIVAALENHTANIDLLFAYGADLHATNANGTSALHTAALEGHTDAVMALIRARVDLDARESNDLGRTALMLATLCDRPAIFGLLVAFKASAEATCSSGAALQDYYQDVCAKRGARGELLRILILGCSVAEGSKQEACLDELSKGNNSADAKGFNLVRQRDALEQNIRTVLRGEQFTLDHIVAMLCSSRRLPEDDMRNAHDVLSREFGGTGGSNTLDLAQFMDWLFSEAALEHA